MTRLYLFVVTSFLGGLGGALGSIVGNALGKPGLWAGGVLGGMLGAAAAVAIAKARSWISPDQARATTIGAMLGFLIAAAIAVNTLSSPIGPILSTGIIGAGALLGARLSGKS